MNTIEIVLIGAAGLVALGLYGLLIIRNMLKVVIALQILVKGALLALVAAGNVSNQALISHSLAMTVIVVDTIIAVMALALVVQTKRLLGTLDIRDLTQLRG